jgi:uncharacterized protein (DUF58 family)
MSPKTLFQFLLKKSAFRKRGREAGPIVLDRRRVFILPTRQGMMFALVLILMFIGSINYDLNLGYALTFLLVGVGLVSILYTHRNLADTVVIPGRAEPVFAGQTAVFTILLENPGRYDRLALGVEVQDAAPTFHDVARSGTTRVEVAAVAKTRGRFPCPPLRIFTRFPLGMLQAWSKVEADMYCLVYPQPDAMLTPFPARAGGTGGGKETGEGNEDFSALRTYRFGDPVARIAWKALAREQGLLTKQFSARASTEVWLDWDGLTGMDTEGRLSRLCRWVIEAEQMGATYGLRLPGRTIPPGNGEQHRGACLEALALFGQNANSGPTP